MSSAGRAQQGSLLQAPGYQRKLLDVSTLKLTPLRGQKTCLSPAPPSIRMCAARGMEGRAWVNGSRADAQAAWDGSGEKETLQAPL